MAAQMCRCLAPMGVVSGVGQPSVTETRHAVVQALYSMCIACICGLIYLTQAQLGLRHSLAVSWCLILCCLEQRLRELADAACLIFKRMQQQ